MAKATPSPEDQVQLTRWRLVLGKSAETHGVSLGDDQTARRVEDLVGFLFNEGEGEGAGRSRQRSQKGGSGGSQLTVPDWVEGVSELFPQQAKEVLERELVQRRGIAELLEQPELLERIEPNMEIVKTLLTHRDLLNPATRSLARKIIDKVVQQLKEKLKIQVEQAIVGAI
ncbi:MAG TPA: hypothetical protein VGE52_01935, partial [Pirellulales bacterium]